MGGSGQRAGYRAADDYVGAFSRSSRADGARAPEFMRDVAQAITNAKTWRTRM